MNPTMVEEWLDPRDYIIQESMENIAREQLDRMVEYGD